ncbi:MAG: hypothetical protein KAI47_27680, partial [Deltaproteobacteria bacterium]|nr:hypothetical protein [Deltaproteobacteria bacterium]
RRRVRRQVTQRQRSVQHQRPAQRPAELTFTAFAKKHDMQTATHSGKLYIKVNRQTLQQNFNEYAQIGGGKVLEFNGTGHLHTRYSGKKDANFLSGLGIGTFRPPSYGKRVTVVVKLTDAEHVELDRYIGAASESYSAAKQVIGSFNYNGGRPKRYYANGGKANCTSWISSAKLDGQHSLGQTCGVWDAASPTGWIGSLVSRGNSRVQAVLLHGFEGNVNDARSVQQFVAEANKH